MRRAGALLTWLCAAALLASAAPGVTAAGGVAAWLDFGVSARSLGVGGAQAAYRDDAASASLNPAWLAWVSDVHLASLGVLQSGGVRYGAVGFAAPHVGMIAAMLDSGWIPTGDGGLRYLALGLEAAGAVPIGPVAIAGRGRLVRHGQPAEAFGGAVDVAALIDLGPVCVGAICDALWSPGVVFGGGAHTPWDPAVCVGLSWTLAWPEEVIWIATVDVDDLISVAWRVVGGVEVRFGEATAARVGWDGEGITLGATVRVSEIGIDWACAVRSDLGTSHRVSLEVQF